MKKIYKEDLVLCLNNYKKPFKAMCRRKTLKNFDREFYSDLLTLITSIEKASEEISEESYIDLKDVLSAFDGIYDTLDTYPEAYGIDYIKLPSMPSLVRVLDDGITEEHKELMKKSENIFGRLPFDWRAK